MSPEITASYSLSLLVALKLHLKALEDVSPVKDVSTIPTLAPLILMDPSTRRIRSPSSPFSLQRLISCSRAGSIVWENSATKSAITYYLIAVAGLNTTSQAPSSTAHLAKRPDTSGLWSTVLYRKWGHHHYLVSLEVGAQFSSCDDQGQYFLQMTVAGFRIK